MGWVFLKPFVVERISEMDPKCIWRRGLVQLTQVEQRYAKTNRPVSVKQVLVELVVFLTTISFLVWVVGVF